MGGGVSQSAAFTLAEAKELAGTDWQPAWEEKFADAEAKIPRDEAVRCWKRAEAEVKAASASELAGRLQDGATPLWIACENGHADAARLLLNQGVDINRADKYGATPLLAACSKGHVDAVRLLLDEGAEVDRSTEGGQTPLFIACYNGHVDAAQLVLDKGAEVDRANEGGVTPLWIACGEGHVNAARLLLKRGAEVNRAIMDGMTPLWIASQEGHVDVARLLLEEGADARRMAKKGTAPLDIAQSPKAIVELFVEMGLYDDDGKETGVEETKSEGRRWPGVARAPRRAAARSAFRVPTRAPRYTSPRGPRKPRRKAATARCVVDRTARQRPEERRRRQPHPVELDAILQIQDAWRDRRRWLAAH